MDIIGRSYIFITSGSQGLIFFLLCPLSLITVCNHTSNQNTKMVDRTVVGGN